LRHAHKNSLQITTTPTSSTLTIRESYFEDTGFYTIVAKNVAGFAISTTELIVSMPYSDHGTESTITEPLTRQSLSEESSTEIGDFLMPTFTRTVQNITIHRDSELNIEINFISIPEGEVRWYRDDVEIHETDRSTIQTIADVHMYTSCLKIRKIQKSESGVYKITVTNTIGTASMELHVNVVESDSFFVKRLDDMEKYEDEDVEFHVVVEPPTATVKWYKDGEEISLGERIRFEESNKKRKLLISRLSIFDEAEYSCVLENETETNCELTVIGEILKFTSGSGVVLLIGIVSSNT